MPVVARIPRSLLAQFPPELARVHYSYTSSKQACHQTLDMTKTACAHVASHATLDGSVIAKFPLPLQIDEPCLLIVAAGLQGERTETSGGFGVRVQIPC